MRHFIFVLSTWAAAGLSASCGWAADIEKSKFEAVGSFVTESKVAERAALRLARDGASVPNMVEPAHFSELRKYYSDRQIVEMLAVISLAGWFNRWNNSIATVTDQESVDWAQDNLKNVGWTLGKHAGETHEQRRKHPRSGEKDGIEY